MRISDWSSDVCSSDLADDDLGILVGDKAAVAAHEAAAVVALRDAALEMVGVRQSTLGVVNGGHGATVAQAPVADKKAGSDPEVDEAAARQGTEIGRASCRERVCTYV